MKQQTISPLNHYSTNRYHFCLLGKLYKVLSYEIIQLSLVLSFSVYDDFPFNIYSAVDGDNCYLNNSEAAHNDLNIYSLFFTSLKK